MNPQNEYAAKYGTCGDQKYLDLFIPLFGSLHVCVFDREANIQYAAPWNVKTNDLLFYHLNNRCFIVIDMKKGDFLPEYAGKMNFYCSAVDDILKHETDQPTVGLILCQGKDKVFAEYTLRGMTKPIGISEYELTRILPDNLKGSLPSVEEIENNLNELGL